MKTCPRCLAANVVSSRHCVACGSDLPADEKAEGDALLGAMVGGKFVLRALIGEGAMGQVFRADQVNLGRTVAVKVMNQRLAADESMVRRFYEEARHSSRLNHPNIVSIIDFGQTEAGILYIVMEYLAGRTLAKLIADEAPLPATRVVGIAGQILDGLAEAHAGAVVHRDLKPDNIMVDALRSGGDFSKILDFGIAKLLEEDRSFRTMRGPCGTPEYMPPEQVLGREVDGRSDLYSLGIVLYEMLTGLSPFAGGNSIEVLERQVGASPRPPRQARPDARISEHLEAVVLRAMQKNRADRYPSAAAMKVALTNALEKELAGERRSPLPGGRPAARTLAFGAVVAPESRAPSTLPILARPEWAALEALVQAQGARALLVSGPEGAGKSMLAAHALRAADAAPRRCFRVVPDSSGAARPWYPIRRLCRELLGLSGTPSLDVLETAMGRASLDPIDLTGLAELFGLVGEFSGLELHPRRRECIASALRLVRAAGAQTPALVVFEDIDRYDLPSQVLLARLLEDPGDGALVVLATRGRERFSPSISAIPVLEPQPFVAEEIASLGRSALGEIDPRTVEAVLAASGGLPLHVEQLLRYLGEGGSEPFPGLADTIGSRIARLPQPARALLQAVALVGGEADDPILMSLSIDAAPDALDVLAQRGFAQRSRDRIRIMHPLVVDVAYEGIPEEARRDLHARLWTVMEQRNVDPRIMARHAYETREHRAVKVLERAGEKCEREFDDAGAGVHLRRAVELQRWAMMEGVADSEEGFVGLSVKLGESLHYAGDAVGGEGVLREALDYAGGAPAREARVRLARARLEIKATRLERAEQELRLGLRAAFKASDRALLGELYLSFGGLYLQRGNAEAAIDELGEGIDLCTGGEGPEGNAGPDVLWRLVARLAETLQQVGDSPAAVSVARHALRHARRVASLTGEARVEAILAQLHDAAGQREQAAEHRKRGLDLIRRLGDRKTTAELLLTEAQTQLKSGRLARDTLSQLRDAAELAAQVGWTEGVEASTEALRKASSPPGTLSCPQ